MNFDINDQQVTLERGSLRIVLDADAIVPGNPGEDTPALVYKTVAGRELTSTWWCAIGTGEIDAEYQLTESELSWLNRHDAAIGDWLDFHTKRIEKQDADEQADHEEQINSRRGGW